MRGGEGSGGGRGGGCLGSDYFVFVYVACVLLWSGALLVGLQDGSTGPSQDRPDREQAE